MLDLIGDSISTPILEDYCLKEINNVNSELSMKINYNIESLYYRILKKNIIKDGGMFNDGFKSFD